MMSIIICPVCSRKNPDTTEVCIHCSHALDEPAPAVQTTDKTPAGLGGWLILLQIHLIGSIVNTISFLLSSVPMFIKFPYFILLALLLLTTILFYSKSRRTKPFLITYFVLNWILGLYSTMGVIGYYYGGRANVRTYMAMLQQISGILFYTALTIYLLRSKRVKNTFVR